MAEAEKTGRNTIKGKIGDRKEAENKTSSKSKWPLIKHKKNLQITRLKENDLFTVQDFFSSAESKAFVKVTESIGFVHQGSLGPTHDEAYDRISVNDPFLANMLWSSKLFSDIKMRGGGGANIRFYRSKDQVFVPPVYFGISCYFFSVNLGDGKCTHYTLLIYLSGANKAKTKTDPNSQMDSFSEPLVGGETVFYGSRNSVLADVAPAEGMVLLHIHGDKCMLHEARNVTKGVKYIFRSDACFA
ncbi:hypothetical protein BDE02_12G109200 [Populus trichocarpa]|nr:hypothetical protein BDE02_12G109200 [Populus trichocarpa]